MLSFLRQKPHNKHRSQLTYLPRVPSALNNAPHPTLRVSEGYLAVSYSSNDDEYYPSSDDEYEFIVDVTFTRPIIHCFGHLNEENIQTNTVEIEGLHPCASFEVSNSQWINSLRQRSSYSNFGLDGYRHFIFTFRDSLFEVIAENYLVEIFKNEV